MTTTSGAPGSAVTHTARQIGYLERLGAELQHRGMRLRLEMPLERTPRLHVLPPDVAVLSESIGVEFTMDGWFFIWSWGERICSAEDVTGTADMITRVLYV